jgi:hypothetical protein
VAHRVNDAVGRGAESKGGAMLNRALCCLHEEENEFRFLLWSRVEGMRCPTRGAAVTCGRRWKTRATRRRRSRRAVSEWTVRPCMRAEFRPDGSRATDGELGHTAQVSHLVEIPSQYSKKGVFQYSNLLQTL